MTTKELKELVRHPYAFPGGYQLFALTSDGELMCVNCVKKNFKLCLRATKANDRYSWCIDTITIVWEGPNVFCCNCNKEFETEYGDPEEKESA